MTAKKQAPHEAVQWVLNFLNLGCIPGEPNPWRLPDEKRKLKRPPLFNKKYISQTLSSLETIEIKEERRSLSLIVGKDKRYVWGLNDKGEYLFDGRNSAPTTEDFRDFFLKYGIPPEKGEDITLCGSIKIKDWKTREPPADRDSTEFRQWLYFPTPGEKARIQIIEIWKNLSDLFLGVAWAPDAGKRKSVYASFNSFTEHILKLYRECLKEDEIPREDYKSNRGFEGWGIDTIIDKGLISTEPFFHYGDLPQALYAIILDFANHFEELHQYLRQCPHCGSFWVKEKNNNKPKVFCPGKCKNVFHQQTRKRNKEAVRKTRDNIKKLQQKKDYKKIVKVYMNNDYNEEHAEQKANDWIYKKSKTYKQFVRKEQSFRGEGLL